MSILLYKKMLSNIVSFRCLLKYFYFQKDLRLSFFYKLNCRYNWGRIWIQKYFRSSSLYTKYNVFLLVQFLYVLFQFELFLGLLPFDKVSEVIFHLDSAKQEYQVWKASFALKADLKHFRLAWSGWMERHGNSDNKANLFQLAVQLQTGTKLGNLVWV